MSLGQMFPPAGALPRNQNSLAQKTVKPVASPQTLSVLAVPHLQAPRALPPTMDSPAKCSSDAPVHTPSHQSTLMSAPPYRKLAFHHDLACKTSSQTSCNRSTYPNPPALPAWSCLPRDHLIRSYSTPFHPFPTPQARCHSTTAWPAKSPTSSPASLPWIPRTSQTTT